MTQLFDIGGPEFGLDDVKVAVNNLNGTFGSMVDIPSVQMQSVAVQTVNAKLRGDNKDTAVHAILSGAEVRVRHGAVSQDALAVMTGISPESSGTTPNRVKRTRYVAGARMPYFGLCGRALAAQGVGDAHLFLPMIKMMTGFTVEFADGAFSIPEYTISAIPDPNYALADMFYEIVEHENAAIVAIPPTY